MALLIYTGQPEWMPDEALRDILTPLIPDAEILCGIPDHELPQVRMIAVTEKIPDFWRYLPNLEVIQKLGAGVNKILQNPALPSDLRITRLAPEMQGTEIAEYCLAYILRYQRNMHEHERHAQHGNWHQLAPRINRDTTVAVLGLGHIGQRVAKLVQSLNFNVVGWSRSPKSLSGISCYHGQEQLAEVIGQSEYVLSVLPSTDQTINLFNAGSLKWFKPGAILVNVGRGDLIDLDALRTGLDENLLGGAVLDVFPEEPLPKDHFAWRHPKITVTPHVSGWHLDDGFADIAENYRRLVDGDDLLYEVDRQNGY